ncbi:MAG: hypothetical protein FWG77_06755 [Treponema sp.]|nr:hypothetical protein [Treponema sp.]
MEKLPGRIFETIPGFEDHLKKELSEGFESFGPLFYSETKEKVFWHRNTWLSPVKIEFDSINEAARALRSLGRNWHPNLFTQYRRGSLIESKLPVLRIKKHSFPRIVPDVPMGAYTLLDANTLLASANCSSPFPGGIIDFEEDKEGPPSRAYLKLWEALTIARKWPLPGERCLDAGCSPGGWSWVLSNLGAEVIAVDRAPLEPKIAAMRGVNFLKHDAFTLSPNEIGRIDWLFCDVVCYPPRLLKWIEKWLESGLCSNFICSIKMQGGVDDSNIREADFDTPKLFAEIPGSTVLHLHHNKHELCWIKVS